MLRSWSPLLAMSALLTGPVLADAGDCEDSSYSSYYVDVLPGPVAFSAISGTTLAPGSDDDDEVVLINGVADGAISPSRIFTLAVGDPTLVVDELVLSLAGQPVSYNLEGIATAADEQGWWLVSEGEGGAPAIESPNLLLRVDLAGNVLQEIGLPPSVAANQVRFGFEGVATSR